MALVLVPGIGVERNGALRWVNIAGFQFQPSEIMKIGVVLILATLIAKDSNRIKKFWTRFDSATMYSITCFWYVGNSRSLKCYDDNSSYNCRYDFYSRC